MTRYIDQFMWSYQEVFRRDLAYRANRAFGSIGLAVDPQAVLVGFAEREDLRHDICVEPENGELRPEHFTDVLHVANDRYEVDGDRTIFVTGDGQQERFEAASRDKVRRVALLEAISAADSSGERIYWVGPSALLQGYRIFPVVSVRAGRWQIGPELPEYEEGRLRLSRSLPDELMHSLLELAQRALMTGSEPQGLGGFADRVEEDLVRSAARSFMAGIPVRVGAMPGDIFDALNDLAATPYEGKPAAGSMVFSSEGDAAPLSLNFATPVSTSRARQVRKLLELSNTARPLVFDSESVFGLAVGDRDSQSDYRIDFFKRSVWVFSYKGEPVLRSTLGRATLPTPALDRELFADNFERVFGGDSSADVEVAWSLIQTASDQGHGTMVVVHRDAAAEALRLGDQAVRLSPEVLNEEALAAATAIDGAILVGPDGACHAIGVILDGVATGSGDPGRGARFNSASRYADSHRSDCLILVVSDDGSVELVPKPRRRVSRDFIERVVNEAVESSIAPIDYEQSSRAFARVEAHRFYLTQAQCEQLVTARRTIEDAKVRDGGLGLLDWSVEPDPWLDESYFRA